MCEELRIGLREEIFFKGRLSFNNFHFNKRFNNEIKDYKNKNFVNPAIRFPKKAILRHIIIHIDHPPA